MPSAVAELRPGSLDTSFHSGAGPLSEIVRWSARQPDGGWILVGHAGVSGGPLANGIIRLTPTGDLDTDFLKTCVRMTRYPAFVVVQPDGRILVGGEMAVNGVSRPITRLFPDGSLDPSFTPQVTGVGGLHWSAVDTVTLQSDGKIIITGQFNRVDGAVRERIARLHPNGRLDTSFGQGMSGVSGSISAAVLQDDGKLVIGGSFRRVNDVFRGGVARLHTNGSLDTTFGEGPMADGGVYALGLYQGKLVIGGRFTSVHGSPMANVARLNSDGSLDGSFGPVPEMDRWIRSLAIEPNGAVVIGGSFSTVDGAVRRGLARLDCKRPTDDVLSCWW